MSFQMAGIVSGVAFVLSFLAGLVGGVPFFDIILRALIWAAVGFGGSLGIETLLRSMVPDLFEPPSDAPGSSDPGPGQTVNITLDEAVPGTLRGTEVESGASETMAEATAIPVRAPASAGPSGGEPGSSDEEMPEIGSFLDAFRPDAEPEGEGEAPSSPGYSEYAPVAERRSNSGGPFEGEDQDPVSLARAVQTVLKRDAQGN